MGGGQDKLPLMLCLIPRLFWSLMGFIKNSSKKVFESFDFTARSNQS
jgi:hypothetical protein